MSLSKQELLMFILASRSSGNNAKALAEVLAQREGEEDPQTQLLRQYLALKADNHQDFEAETENIIEEEDKAHEIVEHSHSQGDFLEEVGSYDSPASDKKSALRRKVIEMKLELKELHHFHEEHQHFKEIIASALGACTLCLGTISECEECHGEGKPGHYEIDHPLFKRWILPACKAYNQDIRGRVEQEREDSSTITPETP